MIISKLISEKYIYINLHAEEVMNSNYFGNSREGINVYFLNTTTIERITKNLIDNIENSNIKILFLNFDKILEIQSNILLQFQKIRDLGFKIIFLNVKKIILEKNRFDILKNLQNIEENDSYKRFYFFEEKADEYVDLEVDSKTLFYEKFKNELNKIREDNPPIHNSSYVYLTTYIDIKKLISKEPALVFYAIYRLAFKVKRKYFEEITPDFKNPILVCQSLNGSYITSILSSFLNLDMTVFDRIGPTNNLYNRLDKNIKEDENYIVVSDFVCLGTEIKITKNLIQFLGGKYLGNVSLIKVETLAKIEKANRTLAIFSIRRDNHEELNYYIYTNLKSLENI